MRAWRQRIKPVYSLRRMEAIRLEGCFVTSLRAFSVVHVDHQGAFCLFVCGCVCVAGTDSRTLLFLLATAGSNTSYGLVVLLSPSVFLFLFVSSSFGKNPEHMRYRVDVYPLNPPLPRYGPDRSRHFEAPSRLLFERRAQSC